MKPTMYRNSIKFISLNKRNSHYIKQIVTIEKKSFPDKWNIKDFQNEISDPLSFSYILKIKNEVIAYIFSKYICNEITINKLCIKSTYRKLGLGNYLIKKFLTIIRNKGIKKVFLEVRKSNSAAISLYKKNEFKMNRIRSKIYKNGDDAYEMVLFL